jgi:rhamnosyltransferase
MQSVSVIIRALNEGMHLERLLIGLKQQTKTPEEIILVDSGSTDDTVEIAERFGCRIVRIEKSEFSFGRSLNLGCAAASGDILLIVSAHVYPTHDGYVENMVAPFNDGRVAITYGRQIGDHRTKYSESRVMLKWFPEDSIWDQGHPFSNNANSAVRRSIWEQFKYDESLTGLEDLDLAKRVGATAKKISYIAEAPVVHVHEETWSTIQNRYRREAIAYKRIIPNSSMSAPKAVSLGLANSLGDFWNAARDGVLRTNLTSIPRFRAAQFFGAWQGFRNSERVTVELLKRFYYPAESNLQKSERTSGNPIDYSGVLGS